MVNIYMEEVINRPISSGIEVNKDLDETITVY